MKLRIVFCVFFSIFSFSLLSLASSKTVDDKTFLPFVTLLLQSSGGEYSESDNYIILETSEKSSQSKVVAYREENETSTSELQLENTYGTFTVSASLVRQDSYTRMTTIVSDGQKSFTIVFYLENEIFDDLISSIDNAATSHERQQVLTSVLETYGFGLQYNDRLERLEIAISKELVPTMSGSTYVVKYDDTEIPDHSLYIIEDDPITGWYFGDETDDGKGYELPDNAEGGTIIVNFDPILFNGGNITVNYRRTLCEDGEKVLFRLADLFETEIHGLLESAYLNVCVSSDIFELDTSADNTLFSYDSEGKYITNGGPGFPVNLATTDSVYQVSVKIQSNNPNSDIYSCLGSFDSVTRRFGDCGYTYDRIWVGVTANAQTVTSAGQVWLDRNLGASKIAASANDSDAYGDYYQWGRGPDGHKKGDSLTISATSSTPDPGHGNFIINNDDWISPSDDNLWQGAAGTNNPCPEGFRLPTSSEFTIEYDSWVRGDSSGAFSSPLKLTVAGNRLYTGFLSGVGNDSCYWSSTVATGEYAYRLHFDSQNLIVSPTNRASGCSVRCIQD